MRMSSLSETERIILNNLQKGFPVTERPFRELESEFGLKEKEILKTLQKLDRDDRLSRFGAVLNTRAMGGDSRLAAMKVPDERLEEVISTVNDYRTVSHNYLRNHALNLWFVLSANSRETIDDTIESIENETRLSVYNLPKLEEYYVGLKFRFQRDGTVTTVSMDQEYHQRFENSDQTLTEPQRRMVRVIQDGIPIKMNPYQEMASHLNYEVSSVIETLRELINQGKIKRLGCVPNHYNLGIRGNAMAVFNVPDRLVNQVGKKLGRRDEVTHCYKRPRKGEVWPYNLFAMVHDRTEEEAIEKVESLRKIVHLHSFDYEVLFSKRLLKKTGLRLASNNNEDN